MQLNDDQSRALKVLQGTENVFLTGAAGSGKSYLLGQFLKDRDSKAFPILASTGAAAILVGGRTFHSFFGLGIMEKGVQATVERATSNKLIAKRMKQTSGIIIDEVSMLSGPVLRAAEMIARKTRGNSTPWGGLRVIAVGDFAQLPPVNPYSPQREWAFQDDVWELSAFEPAVLHEIMRTQDTAFLEVLNSVRNGVVDSQVTTFLDARTASKPTSDFEGTRLFARREHVEKYNLMRLEEITTESKTFQTIYTGKPEEIEKFKKNSPIGDVITLKEEALVMLRQNDPERQWVNGSLGRIKEITDTELTILLLNRREIRVKPCEFTLLDAGGEPVVTAKNFPVSLAWAVTIHKAQGASLDCMIADLRGLWEPGQGYVALSRAKNPNALFLEGWHPSSLKVDPAVTLFHQKLREATSYQLSFV